MFAYNSPFPPSADHLIPHDVGYSRINAYMQLIRLTSIFARLFDLYTNSIDGDSDLHPTFLSWCFSRLKSWSCSTTVHPASSRLFSRYPTFLLGALSHWHLCVCRRFRRTAQRGGAPEHKARRFLLLFLKEGTPVISITPQHEIYVRATSFGYCPRPGRYHHLEWFLQLICHCFYV